MCLFGVVRNGPRVQVCICVMLPFLPEAPVYEGRPADFGHLSTYVRVCFVFSRVFAHARKPVTPVTAVDL